MSVPEKTCYRITDGFNFLYITGDGIPKWRDEEHADSFTKREEAQRIIDGCGYYNDPEVRIEIRPYYVDA